MMLNTTHLTKNCLNDSVLINLICIDINVNLHISRCNIHSYTVYHPSNCQALHYTAILMIFEVRYEHIFTS